MYGKVVDVLNDRQSYAEKDYPTIFHEFLNNPNLPPEEKTADMLFSHAYLIVIAGFETTGNTLSVATYHLLANPDKLERLKRALVQVWANLDKSPTWADLEQQVPYLTAVIQESLRLSTGVSSRLARVNPCSTMHYGEYQIPPGGMTSKAHLEEELAEILTTCVPPIDPH